MFIPMIPSFFRTAAILSITAVVVGASSSWEQWTCDQLTPNLCNDLQVEVGSLVIRSIPVKYWRYKRMGSSTVGDEDTTISDQTIIALHGGPSWPHDYLLPLKQLACRGAEVIFYDQAGCGESSTFQNGETISVDDNPHLLDPAYYSEEELPALIDHWKLDKYHVLGHSWGTILAQLFTLNAANTNGLQSLILSGPLSDAQSYVAAQWEANEGNLGSLPPFVQGRIKELEKDGAYDSEEYKAIDNVLTTYFTLRTAPAPDCFTSSASGLNEQIYVGMQGASEFTISGVLGDFNVTGRLHEINVPVLLTHGQFDTMRPSIVKKMEQQIKSSERVLFPHSGHVSMIDDAGLMNDVVADFVRRVQSVADNSANNLDHYYERKVDSKERSLESEERTGGTASKLAVFLAFILGLAIGRVNMDALQRNNRSYTTI